MSDNGMSSTAIFSVRFNGQGLKPVDAKVHLIAGKMITAEISIWAVDADMAIKLLRGAADAIAQASGGIVTGLLK